MKRLISALMIVLTVFLLSINTFANIGDEPDVQKYITTTNNLNLRKSPTTASEILKKIPTGTILTIPTMDNGWGKVTYMNRNGWISLTYVLPYDDRTIDVSDYTVEWNVIDVSKWQNDVNWNILAESDIDAVIIRMGFRGTATDKIHMDDMFFSHYEGAVKAGLHVGCYFYSTATTIDEAKEEANFIIDTIEKYDLKFDMPVYLDMEDKVVENTGETQIFKMSKAFLDVMDEANIYSGIYCSNWWASDFYADTLFPRHSLWIAEWRNSCSYEGAYGMWQYTDSGKLDGIYNSYVDRNICYINYPKLIEDYGYNNFKEDETTTEMPTTEITSGEINSQENESSEPETNTGAIQGDINMDGEITASDARMVLRFSSEIDDLTPEQIVLADMNSDTIITASDARTILRIAASLI